MRKEVKRASKVRIWLIVNPISELKSASEGQLPEEGLIN
jgi:hypothetical protein